MKIDKSDVEWFISLVVTILIGWINRPENKNRPPKRRRRRKRKR